MIPYSWNSVLQLHWKAPGKGNHQYLFDQEKWTAFEQQHLYPQYPLLLDTCAAGRWKYCTQKQKPRTTSQSFSVGVIWTVSLSYVALLVGYKDGADRMERAQTADDISIKMICVTMGLGHNNKAANATVLVRSISWCTLSEWCQWYIQGLFFDTPSV